MIIEDLMARLADEFEGEVVFYPAMPGEVSTPSVGVTTGEPFITIDSMGKVEEKWDVFVAVPQLGPDRGTTWARSVCLRIMRAAHDVGARYDAATSLRLVPKSTTVMIINTVRFKYDPRTVIIEHQEDSST